MSHPHYSQQYKQKWYGYNSLSNRSFVFNNTNIYMGIMGSIDGVMV